MKTRRLWLIASVALGLFVAAVIAVRRTQADSPQPEIRTFGFLMDAGGGAPDYWGEDSIAVVALPGATEGVADLSFCHCEENGALRGTKWRVGDGMHITPGPSVEQGAFVWPVNDEGVADIPPAGAHAFTGPNGSIIDVQVYPIRVCGANCVPSTSFYVTSVNPTDMLVVVTAMFSK